MKIEINAPENPTGIFTITYDGKHLRNSNSAMFPRQFNDDEIFFLIGENNFKKFEGGQYKFDIPKWKLDTVEGMANPKTKEQLKYSYNWSRKYY